MVFALHPGTDLPLYLQIKNGLREEISEGRLPTGARLPSSRQLARDLGVSRITVANAYAELEADGLIQPLAGSGTFVSPPWPVGSEARSSAHSGAPWQERLRNGLDPTRDQMLRQALRGWGTEAAAPFGWGAGDASLFPAEQFRQILNDVLRTGGGAALGPEFPDGFPPLRQALARYLHQLGIDAGADEIVVTAGTQQTIELLARALLERGNRVVVEAPTWPGALEAFDASGIVVVGVPLDSEGMRSDALELALQLEQPSLIYTVPTFHNPTGITMSAKRRQEVVALAHHYGVPILEDDHVREVRFGSPIPPPLAAIDRHGDVIYAASFTKSVMPALRTGYVVARGPLRDHLVAHRRALDLFGSTLLQRALARYLESGAILRHWKRISRIYRRRHAAMLSALRRHFPDGTRWVGTEGGLVLWVKVPESVPVMTLLRESSQVGVSFAPGPAFFPLPSDQPFLRLNFAAVTEQQIAQGIETLGRLLSRRLAETSEGTGLRIQST